MDYPTLSESINKSVLIELLSMVIYNVTILESPTQPAETPPKTPPRNPPKITTAMSKLSARTCETAKASTSAMDRLLGDGDGLFLRVRPNGTKTWVVEYEFQARRR